MLRSCHEQDPGQMMLFHQMGNDHRDTAFVVTDQGVTIGHIHDFRKKNRGDPVIFPGKFIGIILTQLDSQCSIINNQTIQSADQAVVMYGIKLIVIGIFLFAAQDIFEKVLSPGSQKKTDIYVQLCRCLRNPLDMLFWKIGMHSSDENSKIIPLFFFHLHTSRCKNLIFFLSPSYRTSSVFHVLFYPKSAFGFRLL